MKQLRTLALCAALAALSLSAQAATRTITANSATLDVAAVEAGPVVVSRILFAGYNSICLPMTLNAEQLQTAAEGVQVERLAAIRQEGATLCLYFLDCTDEGIQAGVPYLIYSPRIQNLRANTANADAISQRLQPVTLSDEGGNRITFGSSWTTISADGRYGIPARQDTDILQSILIRTTTDKQFLPTRCGFDWTSQAPTATTLEIKHITTLDAIQTGISSVQAREGATEVFDLAGRQVNANGKLPAGIYVINGEKVAVK